MSSLKDRQIQLFLMGRLHDYGLLVFAFSLPIFEAPKHIGFFMMLTGFTGMALLDQSISHSRSIRSGKPDAIEYLVIAILIVAGISTLLNRPMPEGIKGMKYVFYCVTTFWMVYRNRYSRSILTKIPIALVAGTLAGIVWAGYDLFSAHMPLSGIGEFELKFNSINSVSRSGAYAATILFVCVGVLMDKVGRFTPKTIIFFVISWVLISISTLVMGGRGNLMGIIAAYLFLLIPLLRNKKFRILMGIQTAVVLIAVMVLMQLNSNDYRTGRFQHLLATKFTFQVDRMPLNDQIRYDYWRIGLAQFFQHPSLFGVGPLNFESVKLNNIHLDTPLRKQTLELINGTPDHSHNWIISKLVEDGFVGLVIFIGFIFTLVLTLWRYRPANADTGADWMWIAAFSAIITAGTSGLFNSAFTHENGWLTFFLMGIGTGYSTQNTTKSRPHAD